MEDARKSRSEFFLPKNVTDVNAIQRQQKRPREELEIPSILVETAGSSSANENLSRSTPLTPVPELEGNRQAIKLDRLIDKIDRYNSHTYFLKKCVTENVIPNSYKVIIEPSIGNHDEKFLKGYFDLLEQFSKTLMKYTSDYCEEKLTEFNQQKLESVNELQESTQPDVYSCLSKTLSVNSEKRKRTLTEIKNKKFIRLKYQSKQPKAEPNEEKHVNQRGQPTYATVIQRRPSKQQINQGDLSRKNSTSNLYRKNSRSNLKPTNQKTLQNNTFDNKISDLEKQIKELRQSQHHTSSYEAPTTSSNIAQQPKNGQPRQSAQGDVGSTKEVEVQEVLEYISTAMATLGEFEKRFKRQQSTQLIHSQQ